MDTTIVIVNWNGGEMLHRCLASIRASRTSFRVKVIVVDNDSSDGSREAAQRDFPEFHTFNSGANLGFGRANNLARDIADTPLVLILNPDTELRPDTLQQVADCMRAHPDVGALGCKMHYLSGEVQEQGLQWDATPLTVFLELLFLPRSNRKRFKRWLPLFDPNQSGYITKLYGGFVFARREVLDQAGWFDDRYFMYAEDVDLSRTIRNLGWKLFYCADTHIIHVGGGTTDKAPSGFSILMKHESINKYMRKYHGVTGAIMHRIAILSGALIRLLALLLAWPVSRLRGQSRRWGHSYFKHRMMLLWALGLKNAVPATSRNGAPVPKADPTAKVLAPTASC